MNPIEVFMYQISGLFLMPVLLIILALFVYAFYLLGRFAVEAVQRRRPGWSDRGCALARFQAGRGSVDSDALELEVMKQLEPLRIVSRTAPMLGLVATMIPLGPALLALGDGELAEVGQNLVVAFAAVILALVTASIVFLILNVRRRWLLDSLHRIERGGGA
ncbi:MAG: MotA/TolQ/ExbB proton channel family protein [Lysobacteraceae bacterium]